MFGHNWTTAATREARELSWGERADRPMNIDEKPIFSYDFCVGDR